MATNESPSIRCFFDGNIQPNIKNCSPYCRTGVEKLNFIILKNNQKQHQLNVQARYYRTISLLSYFILIDNFWWYISKHTLYFFLSDFLMFWKRNMTHRTVCVEKQHLCYLLNDLVSLHELCRYISFADPWMHYFLFSPSQHNIIFFDVS